MLLLSIVLVALAFSGVDCSESVLVELLKRLLDEKYPWEVTLNAQHLQRYPPKNNKVDFRVHEIADIAFNAFRNVPDVTAIDLSENSIREIEDNAFKGLKKLTRLNLAKNELTGLKVGMFSDLEKLSYLDLSRNEIRSIEDNSFSALAKLKVLRLHHNKLGSLSSGTFRGLGNLETLFLYNNWISTIENGTFDELHQLGRLDLSSNQLTRLDEDCFRGLTQGVRHAVDINLRSNPLQCDSDLCWLKHESVTGRIRINSLDCNDNTNWYTRTWNCTTPDCGDAPDVEFAAAHVLWEGWKVFYECESCYEGGGSINCGTDGTWPPTPTCTRGACPWYL